MCDALRYALRCVACCALRCVACCALRCVACCVLRCAVCLVLCCAGCLVLCCVGCFVLCCVGCSFLPSVIPAFVWLPAVAIWAASLVTALPVPTSARLPAVAIWAAVAAKRGTKNVSGKSFLLMRRKNALSGKINIISLCRVQILLKLHKTWRFCLSCAPL